MHLRTEQANEHYISKAKDVLDIIDIEVKILWNSTFVNSSAQPLPCTSEISSSPDSVGMTSAKVWTASSDHIMTDWALTGSASTATPSSGMWRTNGSLWATGVPPPTAKASLTLFSGKSSAGRISEGTVGLLVTMCCVAAIFI